MLLLRSQFEWTPVSPADEFCYLSQAVDSVADVDPHDDIDSTHGSIELSSVHGIPCDETDAAYQSLMLADHFLDSIDFAMIPPVTRKRSSFASEGSHRWKKSDCKVRFKPVVQLHAWDQERETTVLARLCNVHQQFRTLWHLDGQTCPNHVAFAVLEKWNSSNMCPLLWGPIYSLPADIALPCGVRAHARARQQWLRTDCPQVNRPADVLWPHVANALQQVLPPRRSFINVWFLENGRRDVCIAPRRIEITSSMTPAQFQEQALLLWSDALDSHTPVEFVLVSHPPPATRNSVAHVILLQSRDAACTGVLVQCSRFPVLQQTRAIIIRHGHTVARACVTAQLDHLLGSYVRAIFVGPSPSLRVLQASDLVPAIPGACFVVDLQHLHRSDDESSQTDSDADSDDHSTTDGAPGEFESSDDDSWSAQVAAPHDGRHGSGTFTPCEPEGNLGLRNQGSPHASKQEQSGKMSWSEIPLDYCIQDVFGAEDMQVPWSPPIDQPSRVHGPFWSRPTAIETAFNLMMEPVLLGQAVLWAEDVIIDESSLMQRNRSRSRDDHPASEPVANDTEVEGDPSSSSSAEPSESDSPDDNTGVYAWAIVSSELQGDPPIVHTGLAGPTMVQAEMALQVPHGTVTAVHLVRSLMHDGRDYVALAVLRDDWISSATEVIILFDALCRSQQQERDHAPPHLFHSVSIVRKWLTYTLVIQLYNLEEFARHFPHYIAVYHNGVLWSPDDVSFHRLLDGDYVQIVFADYHQAPHRAALIEWLRHEEIDLWPDLLQSGHDHGISPTLPFVSEPPSAAASSSTCGVTDRILGFPGIAFQSWYLSHARFPTCHESRVLILSSDPAQWRAEISRIWPDRFKDDRVFSTAWIQPQPAQTGQVAYDSLPHILIEQDPSNMHVGVLISTSRGQGPDQMIAHSAYSVPQWMHGTSYCQTAQVDVDTCFVQHAGNPVPMDVAVRRPTGQAVEIQITTRPSSSDHSSMLQLHMHKQATWGIHRLLPTNGSNRSKGSLDSTRNGPPVTILLDPVLPSQSFLRKRRQPQESAPALLWFDRADWQSVTLGKKQPCWAAVPDGLQLKPSTYHALLQQPDWDPDQPWHFAFYIDGATHGVKASWAVVAVIVQGQREWCYGCIAADVQTNTTCDDWLGASHNDNIAAELTAMVAAQCAGRWLGPQAFVEIRPDLQLSMRLAQHHSTCKAHQPLAQLVQLQARWMPNTAVYPIPGHSDHPWNDLADSLAKFVMHSASPVGSLDFHGLHQIVEAPHDLQWAAMQDAPPTWQHCWPAMFQQQWWQFDPCHLHMPHLSEPPAINTEHGVQISIDFRVVSANVLALDGRDLDTPVGRSLGPRTVRLDHQFHEASATIVGLQEARTPAGSFTTDHYHVLASGAQSLPATSLGCELWIHRSLAFATAADGTPLAFDKGRHTALTRGKLHRAPPFQVETAVLASLAGLLPPADQLHADRLKYLKRFVTLCPPSMWAWLKACENSADSWLQACRASLEWMRRFYKFPLGIPLLVIHLDDSWKGKVTAAAKSCRRYRLAQAEYDVWLRFFCRTMEDAGLEVPQDKPTMPKAQWTCLQCSQTFASKKALAVHSYQIHGYRARARYYALGSVCNACGMEFSSRIRLQRHLEHVDRCMQCYTAAFPPAAETTVDQLDEEDRREAEQRRAHGWHPLKALTPAFRVAGPCLPPADSQAARLMLARASARQGPPGTRFGSLAGRRDDPDPGDAPRFWWHRDDLPEFVMQSNGGPQRGHGHFDMIGLAKEAALLHVRAVTFVHFFSGYRRDQDLHAILQHRVFPSGTQVFVLSIDLCLQRETADLATDASMHWWLRQVHNGLIIGAGGGPPCETWTAARLQGEGPPPVRSALDPWGLPTLTQAQHEQVLIGTRLSCFLYSILLAVAHRGGAGFYEHPQFPVWATPLLPCSTWATRPPKLLRSLACTTIVSFDQCIYGAPARKPTTLLLIRLSSFRHRTLCSGLMGCCPHGPAAHEALKGRDLQGEFRTARCKIYPPAMNIALADSITHFIESLYNGSDVETAENLPTEFECFQAHTVMEPNIVQRDFHGLRPS
eukprot:Skav208021  [mRNA]  locus=scaffold2714:74524:83538:+ [translate_table: standard]